MEGSKKRTLEKLTSTSTKQVYNALIQIRTNIIKSPGGVGFLVSHGAIPKLIRLLGKDVDCLKGTCDIVLSILGNLCMAEEARKNVQRQQGVSAIAEYFCESESESIQNRGCRTLANLALSPSACEDIHQTEAIAKIVTLLKNAENKDCQLTYCRAIRLLGRTPSQIENLINENAVSAVCKLLACDDGELKTVGLRALFELSRNRCSSGFANQVIGAGIIKDILDLTSSDDSTVSHHAFSTIFKLIDQPDFRPPFGSAGGITLFIQLLDSDLDKDYRVALINVLCLCSKDVVNRSKIREDRGLVKFLNFLQDDEMHVAHDRIISALLCYLYDDQSINFLLENNMITILIGHLQRVAKFKSYVEDFEFSRDKEESTNSEEDEYSAEEMIVSEEKGKEEGNIDTGIETSKEGCVNEEIKVFKNHGEKLDIPKICIAQPPEHDSTKVINQVESNFIEDVNQEGSIAIPIKITEDRVVSNTKDKTVNMLTENADNLNETETEPKLKQHVFSIDSPTYEINTDWNFEDSRMTSKQNFIRSFDTASTSLSPLSTISYYSPSLSSPDYSPCHSPRSESCSSLNNDPDYPLVCSAPYYIGSPEKRKSNEAMSPLGYSPCPSDTQQNFVYSDSEDEESTSAISSDIQNKPETKKISEVLNIEDNTGKFLDIENGIKINRVDEVGGKKNQDKKEEGRENQDMKEGSSEIQDVERSSIVGQNSLGRSMEIEVTDQRSENQNVGGASREIKATEGRNSEIQEKFQKNSSERINQITETEDTDIKTETSRSISKDFPCDLGTDTVLKSTLKQIILNKKRQNFFPEFHATKRRRVVQKSRTSPTSTEIHISMILSRASQVTYPSKYMVTMETTCCLLDYLSDVDKPETRIARVLSRLVRNPDCYEKFLHMNLPLLVFQKLLAGHLEIENLSIVKTVLKDKFSLTQGGIRSGQRSRSSSVSSTSSDLSLLDLDDSFYEPQQSVNPEHDTMTDMTGASTSSSLRDRNRKSVEEPDTMSITEGISLRVKVGLSLLHDLFFMANSPFGRGIIAHWFARKEQTKKLQCAVCLLYITWYSGMQQFYFFKLRILDDVLQILLDRKPVGLYSATLNGLVFLGKMLNLNLKLKVDNLHELFINANHAELETSMIQDQKNCVYSSLSSKHDLRIKIVENELRVSHETELSASRETLVKASPMFAAMLEGHYSESKQSEIRISETSCYAVKYVIHYFHGCSLDCDIMADLLTCDSTNENLDHALEVLSLAHKYMLTELYHFLQTVIGTRFLSCQNAWIVYEFATLHSFEDLAVDSVKSVFLERSDDRAIYGIKKCLQGPTAKSFLNSIKNLLRKSCS